MTKKKYFNEVSTCSPCSHQNAPCMYSAYIDCISEKSTECLLKVNHVEQTKYPQATQQNIF